VSAGGCKPAERERERVHGTFASATLSGGRWRLASFWKAFPMFEEEDAMTVRTIARKSAMGSMNKVKVGRQDLRLCSAPDGPTRQVYTAGTSYERDRCV